MPSRPSWARARSHSAGGSRGGGATESRQSEAFVGSPNTLLEPTVHITTTGHQKHLVLYGTLTVFNEDNESTRGASCWYQVHGRGSPAVQNAIPPRWSGQLTLIGRFTVDPGEHTVQVRCVGGADVHAEGGYHVMIATG